MLLCWPRICLFKCCVICVTAALKDKGNEAYAQEDYETAVKYYSDGLAEIRDMQPLYTNRAQVNILCYSYSTMKPPCHNKEMFLRQPEGRQLFSFQSDYGHV